MTDHHATADGCLANAHCEMAELLHAVLARFGNQPAPPAAGVDRSHISDGYHTFAELYDHRHSLMLALMRAIPKLCWFSQQHADGEMPFGTAEWFIAGVDLPTGAITYHLPSELLSLAQQTGAAELSVGRPWDGHTANDVIERLRAWVASPQPAPPAEGEVAELVAWLERTGEGQPLLSDEGYARLIRAADLLSQRQAAPVPVAVSEKWPSHADLGTDGAIWFRHTDKQGETHWLPDRAIPLPGNTESGGCND